MSAADRSRSARSGSPELITAAARLASHLAVAIGVVLVFVPLALTVYASFFDESVIVASPRGYTTNWYFLILDTFGRPLVNSLVVSALAVSVSVCLGVAAAIGLHRHPSRATGWANALLLSPLTLPGIAIGVGVYIFAVLFEIVAGVRLINSFALLVAAHMLITIPWIVRLCLVSLASHDPAIEEAAASLGARPLTVIWRITLPVIRPGIVAGTIFAFIISFENLDLALFLAGPGTTTLPVATLGYLEYRVDPLIAALAVVQIVLIGLVLVILDRFVNLGKAIR